MAHSGPCAHDRSSIPASSAGQWRPSDMIGAAGIGCGAHPEELALGEGQGALEPGGGIGLAERQLRVQMLQGDGAPAKPSTKARSMALSRSEPPRSLSISATMRSNALAALVRPSSSRHVSSCGWVALCERRHR